MSSLKIKKGIFFLISISIAFSSNIIYAQVLEEVVVTARKRSESLQDVPATVTAFSSELIEQAGINNMRDFVGMTSNISLVETQNSSFTFVNIRGLTQVRNVEPSVALVIDGVLNTTGLGFSQDMYHIEQIEVLKGPQGALYGRNATGGAINITTKQPTNEFEGMLKAGYGNGDNVTVVGMASGPVIEDKLYARGTLSYQDADGWRDQITLGGEADPYENLAFNGRLVWDASDDVKVDLRFNYSDSEAAGANFVANSPNFVAPNTIFGSPANAASTPGNGDIVFVPGVPPPIMNVVGDPNNTSVQIDSNTLGLDSREVWSISGKIDWETDFGTITSVTNYEELDGVTAGDQVPYFPFLQIPPGPPALGGINAFFGQNRFHEGFTQEIRITSSDDQRLRWIVGGYYADTSLETMIAINQDTGQGPVIQGTQPNIGGASPTYTWDARYLSAVVPALIPFYNAVPAAVPAACQAGGGGPFAGVNAPLCGAIISNPNTNAGALSYNYDRLETTAFALFGQINYDITDDLELSLALRYDNDDRDSIVRADAAFLPSFPFPAAMSGDRRNNEYDSLQPKVTLRYQPNDDMTLYATYAQGFRAGGFNLSGVRVGVQALTAAGVPGLPAGVQDSWEQEDSEGYELGFKSTLLDGRLSLGGSVFYTELDDAFTFTFVAPFTAQVIRNIDEAEILGFELDANWLPTDNLQLNAGFGYTDTEIKASSWLGAAGINIVGNKLPWNPEYTFNLGLSYNRPITDTWQGFLRFDYQRLGEMYGAVENFAPRDELDLVNGRMGIQSSDGWEIALWSRNLTDENYIAEQTNPGGFVFYGRLRQYGIEVVKHF